MNQPYQFEQDPFSRKTKEALPDRTEDEIAEENQSINDSLYGFMRPEDPLRNELSPDEPLETRSFADMSGVIDIEAMYQQIGEDADMLQQDGATPAGVRQDAAVFRTALLTTEPLAGKFQQQVDHTTEAVTTTFDRLELEAPDQLHQQVATRVASETYYAAQEEQAHGVDRLYEGSDGGGLFHHEQTVETERLALADAFLTQVVHHQVDMARIEMKTLAAALIALHQYGDPDRISRDTKLEIGRRLAHASELPAQSTEELSSEEATVVVSYQQEAASTQEGAEIAEGVGVSALSTEQRDAMPAESSDDVWRAAYYDMTRRE